MYIGTLSLFTCLHLHECMRAAYKAYTKCFIQILRALPKSKHNLISGGTNMYKRTNI